MCTTWSISSGIPAWRWTCCAELQEVGRWSTTMRRQRALGFWRLSLFGRIVLLWKPDNFTADYADYRITRMSFQGV